MNRIAEPLKVLALLIFCIGVPWIAWDLTPHAPSPDEAAVPSHSELLSLILTAVTIVLAVLAIVIAILAVWGYQSIKGEAAAAADRAVKGTVEGVVGKHVTDEKLAKLLSKAVRDFVSRVPPEALKYPGAYATAPGETQQGSVGTDYPEGGGDDGQSGT